MSGSGNDLESSRANEHLAGGDEKRAALASCLERVANGDAIAMRELVGLTQARLAAVAFRLLQDQNEVEDVIQDVYLTVWRKAAHYQPGRAHGLAWLTVITRNRCLDRLRRRAAHQNLPEHATACNAVVDEQPDLEERIVRLTAQLESLDAETRDAIKAAFFGGLTYEALARASSVPLGTMKSRIRRGLLALRSALRS